MGTKVICGDSSRLQCGESTYYFRIIIPLDICSCTRGFAIVSHIPWAVHVTRWLVKDAMVLGKWARKQVADRRERGATTTKDLFYWLVGSCSQKIWASIEFAQAGEDGTKALSVPETLAEGGLVIVAGMVIRLIS